MWLRELRKMSLTFAVPVLLLLAFAIYRSTFGYPWLFDDFPVIVKNPDIRSIDAFLDNFYVGRPIREITYLIDYFFFGLNPKWYHFQNILWHGLNACLIFLLSRKIGSSPLVAWFAALLFLVHPVAVEVVANTSHRKDSLGLFFSLLAIICYLEALSPDRKRVLWLILAFGSAAVGMLAKENIIVMPLIFLLAEYCFVPQERRFFGKNRNIFGFVVILFFVTAIARIIYLLQSDDFVPKINFALGKMGIHADNAVKIYYFMVIKSQAFLFSKLVVPLNLAPEYTFPAPNSWLDGWLVSGLLLLFTLILSLFFFSRWFLAGFFALSWFLLFWLPTSNFFGHYAYFAADRYLYTPLAGFCLLTGLSAKQFSGKIPFARYSFPLIIIILAVLTTEQVKIWRSQMSLSSQILKVSPESREGMIGLATVYTEQGKLNEALDLYSDFLKKYAGNHSIYKNMSYIYNKLGRIQDAIMFAELSVRLKPNDAEIYSNLGALYDLSGDRKKSIDALKKSISINPKNERAYTSLGIVYEKNKQLELAIEMHRTSIELLPSYGIGYYNLGVVSYKQGKKNEALKYFQRAYERQPGDIDTLSNLGNVAIEMNQFSIAEDAAKKLSKLDKFKAEEIAREVERKKGKK